MNATHVLVARFVCLPLALASSAVLAQEVTLKWLDGGMIKEARVLNA